LGFALDSFLARFDNPLKDGRGFRVRCPAHDDNDPSLHVEQSADGAKVLVVCRAGCSLERILAELHASPTDLFENGSRSNGSQEEGATPAKAPGPARPPFGRITKTYDYVNERNVLVYQVLRDEHKNFRQRRPTNADPGIGEPFTYNLDGVRRVLYRLPEVEAARKLGHRIYVVEGEKDADNLANIGLTATTAAQGAASPWLPTYTDQLTGAAEVVIIPDNDPPGRKHALEVRDALAPHVQNVKLLELPGVPDKGDVSDWLQDKTRDDLESLANDAPPYVLPVQRFSHVSVTLDEFMRRTYKKPRSLLGNGFICAGELAFLYGRPGIGKTWLLLQLADAWSRGEGLFGLQAPEGGPVRVGILELETDAYWLQQRVDKLRHHTGTSAGGACVHVVARPDLKGAVDMLSDDYLALARWCTDEALDVVFIDALSRSHTADENKGPDFGRVLRRFDEISYETGTALLPLHHEPKGNPDGKERDDMDSLRGHSRMSSDCKSLMRLAVVREVKSDPSSNVYALRFPKTNNASPIAPIYLERPKDSGFVVTDDFDPELRKAENVEAVRVALVAAGPSGGATLDQLAATTGLSTRTVKRHAALIGAVPVGDLGDGRKGKKPTPRLGLRGQAGQPALVQTSEPMETQGTLGV